MSLDCCGHLEYNVSARLQEGISMCSSKVLSFYERREAKQSIKIQTFSIMSLEMSIDYGVEASVVDE